MLDGGTPLRSCLTSAAAKLLLAIMHVLLLLRAAVKTHSRRCVIEFAAILARCCDHATAFGRGQRQAAMCQVAAVGMAAVLSGSVKTAAAHSAAGWLFSRLSSHGANCRRRRRLWR